MYKERCWAQESTGETDSRRFLFSSIQYDFKLFYFSYSQEYFVLSWTKRKFDVVIGEKLNRGKAFLKIKLNWHTVFKALENKTSPNPVFRHFREYTSP